MKILFILAVIALSITVSFSKSNSTGTWDYTKADGRPIIIAHRGYASLFPENTLEAFRAAIYAGADFFELDVQITKDMELLVSHDAYLSRVTDIANRTEFASMKQTRVLNG